MVGRNREIRRLEPTEPGRVTMKKAQNGAMTYEIRADDGATRTFTADEIWHIRGPSWAPWMGLEGTKLARNAVGLGIATENTHADMHKGAARVSGLLAVDTTIGQERFESLSAWLDRHAEGGDRAGKPLVMDSGAKYTPLDMSGADKQHIETRNHQVEGTCRAFGVMPLMIGHPADMAARAAVETLAIMHVTYCLLPWYRRIEKSATLNLLSPQERATGMELKFNAKGLMRGAAKDQAELYAKALGAGGHGTAYMTPNEVRALEDMDPMDGGDELPVGVLPAAPKEANDGTD